MPASDNAAGGTPRGSLLTKFVYALAALAFAVALSSCGDSSSGSDASVPLTKSEFIKRADAICDRADQEQDSGIKKFEKESPNATDRASQKKMAVDLGLPPIELEAEALAGLAPPAED